MLKKITASVLAFTVMAAFGAVAVEASEITGSLLIQSGGSTQTGSLAVQVGGNQNESTSGGGGGGDGGGGTSGTRHRQAAIVSDPLIYIDTVPSGTQASAGRASGSGSLGTGGGYDAGLEQFLAASEDSSLSADEAVAYNAGDNPFANTDLVAATADTGLGSAKVWTAVVLGLALLGLAGYAVSALISYRRENDL
jgi:hypothetical protein